jgi:hypothetical protein
VAAEAAAVLRAAGAAVAAEAAAVTPQLAATVRATLASPAFITLGTRSLRRICFVL